MKVKCINNDSVEHHFTVGKIYDVVDKSYQFGLENLKVVDDNGKPEVMYKDEYELVEEQSSEWNGEGYPPVGVPIMIRGTPSGCICEGVIDYIDKVHCIWHWNDGSKNTMYNRIVDMEFKPIKSEKDKEIEKIDDAIDEWQDEVDSIIGPHSSLVWWFNAEECSWHLGLSIFMDFDDENNFEKWTHWLPEDSISNPGD